MNGFDVSARHPGADRANAASMADFAPLAEKSPNIIDLDLR